jgi:hypothetical protein
MKISQVYLVQDGGEKKTAEQDLFLPQRTRKMAMD